MNIDAIRSRLLEGLAIPACPLPLNKDRSWSERHQRALTRYYTASGAGGIAAGVHSTQFEIRDPEHDLYRPVLASISAEMDALGNDEMIRIAGVCGETQQASAEAETVIELGYHAALLSMKAFVNQNEATILKHCQTISELIPIIGFYLQPAVGGRIFSYDFWRQFAEIQNVVAVKIAPFNRYQTIDVVRAVIESGRDDVALYTGNDDNIVNDLLTPFEAQVNGKTKRRYIDGGLLGQWGVWTSCAVRMLGEIKRQRQSEQLDSFWLAENFAVTDANAALFDAANQFAGCIPGIMEILRRNGLAPTDLCLNPNEQLSAGQSEELDRVTTSYPSLTDDDFVAANLNFWLS